MQILTLLGRIKDVLQDTDQDLWTDEELLSYVNMGQDDYARRTKQFRRISRLATGQDPHLFNLPHDLIELLWVEYDGDRLVSSSWREIQEIDTSFTSTTGTPKYWYQDLGNLRELRVYPIPTDNDEDIANFDQEEGAVGALDIVGSTVDTFYPAETGVIRDIVDGTQTAPTSESVTTSLNYGYVSGTLAQTEILPNSVTITATDESGTGSWTDDGAGVISTVGGGTGVIDYKTGAFRFDTEQDGGAITVNFSSVSAAYTWFTDSEDTEFVFVPAGRITQEGIGYDPAEAEAMGVVTQILVSKVRVGYVYRPEYYTLDVEEVVLPDQNESALIWYALFRAFQKDADEKSLAESKHYKRLYDEMTFETARKVADGFSVQPRKARGRYY